MIMDLFKLDGQVALITGASSGIGLETARALAERGANVIVVGRTPARVDAAVSALSPLGPGEILGRRVDFASLAQTRDLAEELREALPAVDVLTMAAPVDGV